MAYPWHPLFATTPTIMLLLMACGSPTANVLDATLAIDAREEPIKPSCAQPRPTYTGAAPARVDWALEASQDSTLRDIALMNDSTAVALVSAAQPFTLGGQSIAATGKTLAAIVITHSGSVVWHQPLLAGEVFAARATSDGQQGAWVTVYARDTVVLGPSQQRQTLPLSNTQVTLLLLHVRETGVALAATISGNVAVDGFITATPAGGAIIGGALAGETLTITNAAGEPTTTNVEAGRSHGWWAVFDHSGAPLQTGIVAGTAHSIVRSVVQRPGGKLAIAGRFGGFPNGLTAKFGTGATPTQLVNVTADDDPSYDAFVAQIAANGESTDAVRIQSYNNSDADIALVDAGSSDGAMWGHVQSKSYLTSFDVEPPITFPNPLFEDQSTVGRWDQRGALVEARLSTLMTLLGQRAATATSLGTSTWTAQPGTAAELAVSVDSALHTELLLQLNANAEVVGARHVGIATANGVWQPLKLVPTCGTMWFAATTLAGAVRIVGANEVTLSQPQSRAVIFGATAM